MNIIGKKLPSVIPMKTGIQGLSRRDNISLSNSSGSPIGSGMTDVVIYFDSSDMEIKYD
jgi:hypothetical protein